MQSTEIMEKWKFRFVKVLIRNQVFHNELLLSALCAFPAGNYMKLTIKTVEQVVQYVQS